MFFFLFKNSVFFFQFPVTIYDTSGSKKGMRLTPTVLTVALALDVLLRFLLDALKSKEWSNLVFSFCPLPFVQTFSRAFCMILRQLLQNRLHRPSSLSEKFTTTRTPNFSPKKFQISEKLITDKLHTCAKRRKSVLLK